MNIKEQLHFLCTSYAQKREETVHTIISSAQKALTSETKSSAGDKHETGRAMLQLEMEKAGQQLHGITVMKETLARINTAKTSNIAHLGSVVVTNIATYYMSISAGEIKVNSDSYFAISVSSPIGKLLLGKKEKDIILFNGKQISINEIY